MVAQLPLDLTFRETLGRDAFYVSDANVGAVRGLDGWRDWPHAKMLLVGPEAAGKTHLAHVWATQSGAVIRKAETLTEAEIPTLADSPALALENVDRIAGDLAAETAVFHLHNALAAGQRPLLVTARRPAARWGLVLPDLASRMAQAGQLSLAPPDDALLAAVMVKMAEDRQLALTPALVGYALPRIERSFAAARDFIMRLDAMALAAKEPPMQKHARAILSEDE